LDALKEIRSQEYVPALERIGQIKGDVNLKPLYKELDNQMKKFNITYRPKSMGGGFDYTNSVLEADPVAQKEFESLHNMIKMREAGQVTIKPKDVDILKRNLQDYYSPNDKIRSLTTNLEKTTRNILEQQVPGYQQMTSNYAKDTALIKEIQKDFSLGTKSSNEQGLSKLIRAMRDDSQFRENFLSIVSSHAGEPLEPKLAGVLAQSWIPTSLAGRMGGMYELIRGTAAFDPRIAMALATSSPRISAEFLNVLGKVGPKIQGGLRYAPQALQALAPDQSSSAKYTTLAEQLQGQK
jgi:hypothetical protein